MVIPNRTTAMKHLCQEIIKPFNILKSILLLYYSNQTTLNCKGCTVNAVLRYDLLTL